jgi:nucleotidyltransferase substrate binding protein (TIGR01987 family)
MLDAIEQQALVDMDYVDIAGWIHIFDLVFELSWKSLRDYMLAQGEGERIDFTREVLQIWFQRWYIDDMPVWIDMLTDRNSSTHEYDEKNAEQLILNIQWQYLPALDTLYVKLQQHI